MSCGASSGFLAFSRLEGESQSQSETTHLGSRTRAKTRNTQYTPSYTHGYDVVASKTTLQTRTETAYGPNAGQK